MFDIYDMFLGEVLSRHENLTSAKKAKKKILKHLPKSEWADIWILENE